MYVHKTGNNYCLRFVTIHGYKQHVEYYTGEAKSEHEFPTQAWDIVMKHNVFLITGDD